MVKLIEHALLINEGTREKVSLRIEGDKIAEIYRGEQAMQEAHILTDIEHIEAEGLWLLPGGIDDQVHFRDPGLTHKGDIESESKAAVAGGITSYMDMPNTLPATIDYDSLMKKRERAASVSWANYGFYIGASNSNYNAVFKLDSTIIAGVKLFLGASTGNLLVDDQRALDAFFGECPFLLAIHSEHEETIRKNRAHYMAIYGEDPPLIYHPLIRSEEACYRSTSEAINKALKGRTHLHVLHISTGKEATLFDGYNPRMEKQITSEVCVHHLWFTDADYEQLGTRIKWNPAIKSAQDRDTLRRAITNGKMDIVATDHAPHLLSEKEGGALKAASGGPLIQYSLLAMLQLAEEGLWSYEQVVDKMCHAPAEIFGVDKRGFVRPGHYADLVLIDPHTPTHVTGNTILSKCGWSPFEGHSFPHSVAMTLVNGEIAYSRGRFSECRYALPLLFTRFG